uniref:Small glutamine-rich tetratricopeptide repeat-containing protein 2 n=1 Tax=Ogataea thermomethanolica (nom. inval.) TaxID=310468 RepID=A0A7R6ZTW5_9ASCO|nr:small glutamine-rich tetratricopeptide repeat-containing protein 2 [Ogataea thermomethanolica (nom. inval.)]
MPISDQETSILIIDFLKEKLSSGGIPEDNKDSIEFAIESISDAFGIEPSTSEEVLKQKFLSKGLSDLIMVPEIQTSDERTTKSGSQADIDSDRKQKAEALKLEGNRAMAKREFQQAIEKYTAALELLPENAVYLSNRAAAYSSIGEHQNALEDAKKATEVEPTYAKAWSRMGLAKYALGDVEGSMKAYEGGLEVEGETPSDAMKKGYETAKKKYTQQLASSLEASEKKGTPSGEDSEPGQGLPDISNLANMFGGSQAEGNSSGLGGLAGLMNNPQIMQAAQRMMQNPEAMNGLLNNPQLRQMAQNFGLGDGNLDELMNNPMLQNLANQFGGGSN